MIRPMERRLFKLETDEDERRQAVEADAQRYAHLSRAELEAAVLASVADFVSCRTVDRARHLLRHHQPALRVLDIMEREGSLHAAH